MKYHSVMPKHLYDGERLGHLLVVTKSDYAALEARCAALTAELEECIGNCADPSDKRRIRELEAALRPVANHLVIDKDNEFIGGCYAIDVVQTAVGLIGTALDQYKRSQSETK